MNQDSLRVPPSVRHFFPGSKPVWTKAPGPRRPLLKINQIAFVVNDVDAAIEYYGGLFGWGPFWPATVSNDLEYQGSISRVELRLAFAMVGDIEIELLQPMAGNTPHHDHLRRFGEGLLHLRLATDDIEDALDHLKEFNVLPVFGYSNKGRWVNVYLNSDQCFGVRFELIPSEDRLLSMVSQFAYEWTGRTEST
jgi:hypothetical protein